MTINLYTDEITTVHDDQVKAVIEEMAQIAASMVVTNPATYDTITQLYRKARDWKKALEDKRKELVAPARAEMTRINDKAKTLSDPLDAVIDLANAKANGYMRHLEAAKRIEDAKIREAASLFDAADEIYIVPMEKSIRGNGAVTVSKTEKKFKLIDLSKVPLKYLMLDEAAIKKDLQLGISSIEGLEVYEETTTQLRIR